MTSDANRARTTHAKQSQSDARAAWITQMIQGTMALECQGLSTDAQARLKAKVQQLMVA